MELVRGTVSLPLGTGGAAVSIVFFDGVHRGHQAVLGRTVDLARGEDLTSVAVTFDRHPREVLTPGKEPPLLTTLDRKAELIEGLGIDALVVLEFTEEFSLWPAEEFVSRVLVEGLNTARAVVGSNFTFGHKAAGNLAVLAELGSAHGFSVEGVGVLELEGRPVSSSSIREALAAGDLHWPTLSLGRRYAIDCRVIPGAGRGRDVRSPTANLSVPSRAFVPAGALSPGKARVAN